MPVRPRRSQKLTASARRDVDAALSACRANLRAANGADMALLRRALFDARWYRRVY